MRNHKLLTITGAMAVSLLSGLLPAIAAPDLTYNGASRYKDAKDNIYIISGSETKITYANVAVTKAPYSDACGFTTLKLSDANSPFPSAIAFNGTSDTVSSIPLVIEKSPYKCVNGVAQWKGTPQTSVFQTSVENTNGSVTVKNIYYPPARTGGASKQGLIAYTATLVKNIKPNVCGFITTPGYANSQKKTSSNLSIGSQPINVATLPINPNPPDCVGGKTLTGSATAVATFNGASLYRTTKNIYFTGLAPQSLNVVDYDALVSKTFSNNSTCGMIGVKFDPKNLPTSIKVGGSTYTRATMSPTSTITFSSCTEPGYIALPADKLYMLDWATYVYKTSDLNIKKLIAETPTIVSKNIAVNACGFAVIPALNMANGYSAGDKVAINGSTPYNVMTLPLSPNAPTCKNGVTYLVSP
jgi:hypothetical protein